MVNSGLKQLQDGIVTNKMQGKMKSDLTQNS